MNILKQIKDFPPIEEQLENIIMGKPLRKIEIEEIGEIEILLTSVESQHLKNKSGNPEYRHWYIYYNNAWLRVESYIANIFKTTGYNESCRGWREIGHWMGEPFAYSESARTKLDRKIKKIAKYDDDNYDIWQADKQYLEKEFQKTKDLMLGKKESPYFCTPDECIEFIKLCPEEKIKKMIYYERIKKFDSPFWKGLPDYQRDWFQTIPKFYHGCSIGHPDLFLYNKTLNKYLFCEVKSEDDKLSSWQINFINWNRKAECFPFIVAVVLKGNYPQWDYRNIKRF